MNKTSHVELLIAADGSDIIKTRKHSTLNKKKVLYLLSGVVGVCLVIAACFSGEQDNKNLSASISLVDTSLDIA